MKLVSSYVLSFLAAGCFLISGCGKDEGATQNTGSAKSTPRPPLLQPGHKPSPSAPALPERPPQ